MPGSTKPRLAVHRFSSCGGCRQLLLDPGWRLPALGRLFEIVHLPEAGRLAEEADAEVALVDGSVTTPADIERLQGIRGRSRFLIALGACAASGGVQALRNQRDSVGWLTAVTARPGDALPQASPITDHVRADWQLWGCPVDADALLALLADLAAGLRPRRTTEVLCLECKRQGAACVLVTRREPCMGAVTRAGCGALCPRLGRACYACFGPATEGGDTPINVASLRLRLAELGYPEADIRNRFQLIHGNAPAFRQPPVGGDA